MTSQTTHGRTQFNRHPRPAGSLQRWVLPRPIPKALNPALRQHARERAEDGRNRLADAITVFAGSMTFVYIHCCSSAAAGFDPPRPSS
jgi:uncharacterized membrane protein